MTSGLPGNNNLPGQFGTWDVYPLFVEDTAKITDRRQTANSLYLSINSLLVGAIAFLAQQGALTSTSLLVVQVFIAFAGYVISRQWHRLLEKYRAMLNFRYAQLQSIEEQPGFPGVLKMYQIESKTPSLFGFSNIEEFIPRLFRFLYVIGTLLLIAGTFAVKLHFGAWLAQFVSIPVLK